MIMKLLRIVAIVLESLYKEGANCDMPRYGNHMLNFRAGFRVMLALCFIQGCAAYNLSSPLLPSESQDESRWIFANLVLAVGPPLDNSQSFELSRFVEDLRKTGLFKAVDYKERIPDADLILSAFSYKETDPFEACPLGFVGQVLTVGSAGLIPQICTSKNEVTFALYSPKHEGEEKKVSFVYQTKTILGWAALFYTPSAAWTAQPSKYERANLLKSVFLHEQADIQKMLR